MLGVYHGACPVGVVHLPPPPPPPPPHQGTGSGKCTVRWYFRKLGQGCKVLLPTVATGMRDETKKVGNGTQAVADTESALQSAWYKVTAPLKRQS